MKAAVLLMVLTALPCFAETNVSQFVTNYVVAPGCRSVGGLIYRTKPTAGKNKEFKLPAGWEQISGTCLSRDGSLLIVQTFKEKINYKTAPRKDGSSDPMVEIGNFLGSSRPRSLTDNRELDYPTRKLGKVIAITNAPYQYGVGQTIKLAMMKIGEITVNGKVYELLDCGTEAALPVVQINPVFQQKQAQLKALALNQSKADQGDAYGQFRMGERYRDGDAVEKDTSKAAEYFAKAAAQGHADAARELQRLRR